MKLRFMIEIQDKEGLEEEAISNSIHLLYSKRE